MRIAKEFIFREIAGEAMLVPTGATTQEFNGLITLSETGRFIWERLEQAQSLDDLAEQIAAEYEVEKEVAKRDAAEFLARFLQAGFVECTKEDKTW